MQPDLLKQRILEAATQPCGVTSRGSFSSRIPRQKAENLEIRDSDIYVKSDPSIRMSIGQFVGAAGLERAR